MLPNYYLQRMVAAVSKRCGICQATVEQVLPAVFDEIRYQVAEGQYHAVYIESFGTFAMIEKPEREHRYTYKGKNEMKRLPPKKVLKFSPTRCFRREVESGQFDPTRHSFSRHPKDPPIRKRIDMRYRNDRSTMNKGATREVKPSSDI